MHKLMKVKIKKLSPDAVIPKKATTGAAAYDVYTPKDFNVHIGRQVIPLDISIELPDGYEAKIEPRSGFSSKGILGFWNKSYYETTPTESYRFDADVIIGKVDSDYRGNIGIILKSSCNFFIPQGTRLAQLTIYKIENVIFSEEEELSNTERANGGFGHTGA